MCDFETSILMLYNFSSGNARELNPKLRSSSFTLLIRGSEVKLDGRLYAT